MGENSKIEWCDHTFNPWVGCTKISPGCDHCYAEGWAKRSGLVKWGAERRRTSAANWRQPLKWNAEAERSGVRRRVFCASLADVFDNEVPEEWRADLFSMIRRTLHLDWLLLTKRIGNARRLTQRALGSIGMHPGMHHGLPQNVWLGITVVNQEEADRDIPKLLWNRARIRFLSCEPLLGALDLARLTATFENGTLQNFNCLNSTYGRGPAAHPVVDWVIVGGESGPGARPFVLEWGKDIVRQCVEASVPVFVKQVGANPVNREGVRCPHIRERKGKAMEEWPEELRVRQVPHRAPAEAMERIFGGER